MPAIVHLFSFLYFSFSIEKPTKIIKDTFSIIIIFFFFLVLFIFYFLFFFSSWKVVTCRRTFRRFLMQLNGKVCHCQI